MASADAIDVDKLTDSEIRNKLKDLGCSSGSVKRSTRRTLTSKLKNLLRAQSKESIAHSCPSPLQFSSGDDSQVDEVPNTPSVLKKKRGLRQTKSSISTLCDLPNKFSSSPNISACSVTSKQRRHDASAKQTTNLIPTDSDSDVDVVTPQDLPSTLFLNTEQIDAHSLNERNSDRRNVINDRLSSQDRKQNAFERQSSLDKSSYLSDYNFAASPFSVTELNYHKTNTSNVRRRDNGDRAYICIHLITIIGFLGITYYVVSRLFGASIKMAVGVEGNYYPICGQENVVTPICIEDVHLMPALDLAQIFVPKIQEMAIDAFCNTSKFGNSVSVPSITEDEAIEYLKEKLPSRKSIQIERDLKNFKILVLANPHWDVQIIASGMRDIEKILFYGEFAAKQFTLPLSCYVNRILYHTPDSVFIIVVISFLFYAVTLIYRFYMNHKENHKRKVYTMVNHIIHVVYEQRRDNNSPDYITIDNCRDLVMNPETRHCHQREWDEAINFIKNYESRIRTEIRNIRGEMVKVWLWVPAPNVPLNSRFSDIN